MSMTTRMAILLIIFAVHAKDVLASKGCPISPEKQPKDSIEYTVALVHNVLMTKNIDALGDYANVSGKKIIAHLLTHPDYGVPNGKVVDCRLMHHRDDDLVWYSMTYEYSGCPDVISKGYGTYVCEYVLEKIDGRWVFVNFILKSICGLKIDLWHGDIDRDFEKTFVEQNPGALKKIFFRSTR